MVTASYHGADEFIGLRNPKALTLKKQKLKFCSLIKHWSDKTLTHDIEFATMRGVRFFMPKVLLLSAVMTYLRQLFMIIFAVIVLVCLQYQYWFGTNGRGDLASVK